MTAVPRRLRVLKEPTKKEEVLQILEEGAHLQPWEICLLVVFQFYDRQARGMQQVARPARALAPGRLLHGFPPRLSAAHSIPLRLPG